MRLWSNSSVQRGNGGFNPEKRLLAAVLQRAITDFLTGDGEIQLSARDWIFSDEDTSETFCFLYICEALDFNASELRKAVSRQLDRAILEASLNSATAAKATKTESIRPVLTPEMTSTMIGSKLAEKIAVSQVVTVKNSNLQVSTPLAASNMPQSHISALQNGDMIVKSEFKPAVAA